MKTSEIRTKYLEFFKNHGHAIVPRANLVPQDDPTTLFTGSGMQPMVPYLLGQKHPLGTRIADSQTCFRAEDIDEVGDNRHTTFFEMLGNWSLGDYFKHEQIEWIWHFLTAEIGLDPKKLYITVFIGDEKFGFKKDTEAIELWQQLFKQKGIDAQVADLGSEKSGADRGVKEGERIFAYDDSKNWWSRAGKPSEMPAGEPGGPSSEVFYDFGIEHDTSYGAHCHPNCDCGRFSEIGNNVFMQYKKLANGSFEELAQKNIDFGGGLERIAAASIDSDDMFRIDVLWPLIEKLQEISGKKYEDHVEAKRIIADHMRSIVFLAADGVAPSNTKQGYVMRRFTRRAIRRGHELGITEDLFKSCVSVVIDTYKDQYPELAEYQKQITTVLDNEEKQFRKTLEKGLREFEKLMGIASPVSLPTAIGKPLTGELSFELFDTHGFPLELSREEAKQRNIPETKDLEEVFNKKMAEQKERSRTATKGQFKGGLADNSEIVTRYHTVTHLMYRALKNVLGDHVAQRGSNITNERTRFDFTHHEKMTPEQIKAVEDMVNDVINRDLPVGHEEMTTDKAFESGAIGAFGDKYGDSVTVYTVGDTGGDWYSREICGGPHVTHTGEIGHFKIIKEESSSAGVRRIKAVIE